MTTEEVKKGCRKGYNSKDIYGEPIKLICVEGWLCPECKKKWKD